MPNKLKELKVKKVDFVDAGCNQGANILLYKRAPDGGGGPPAKEAGALQKVLAAVAKAMGADGVGTAATLTAIAKDGAVSFDDKLAQNARRQAADEMWNYGYMLQDSLSSIFWDNDVPDRTDAMLRSLEEYYTAAKAAIPFWAGGKPVNIQKSAPPLEGERLTFAKAQLERLQLEIAKVEPQPTAAGEQKPGEEKKGAIEDMKIDKSKLTAEEAAALDAIEKKAGLPDETPPAPPMVEKAAPVPPAAPVTEEGEDIYKGLHPAVKAELERLRKSADSAEERELQEVAKKYELLGKKPEELVPTLKSLKAAGGDAYNQMLTVLDASLAAVQKSGIFKEVGFNGAGGGNDPWETIEKHADEIMKAAPTMTRAVAVDKACEQHPELVAEYEKARG